LAYGLSFAVAKLWEFLQRSAPALGKVWVSFLELVPVSVP
jgi:hypothetical protein